MKCRLIPELSQAKLVEKLQAQQSQSNNINNFYINTQKLIILPLVFTIVLSLYVIVEPPPGEDKTATQTFIPRVTNKH